ncbi:hypothetical protein [Paraburkholderia domus]|uniref:hypothetical protein n=1 Tax=Paraburkholderia domus TaxID=2793075 RepID=UPI00191179D1|nr:hypothetical protein [Paraburkholderia domus]MBK5090091.1 hypothetical protein [Burkholderia sp. R-69927]MBK5169672.1 hypothetical protein [Burkholderia sp. R-70211]MCI0150114.1 hypothetical protein [Paraburkholderia sediminicola]
MHTHRAQRGTLFCLSSRELADQCSTSRTQSSQCQIEGNHLNLPFEIRPVFRIATIDNKSDATQSRKNGL